MENSSVDDVVMKYMRKDKMEKYNKNKVRRLVLHSNKKGMESVLDDSFDNIINKLKK